MRKIHIPLLLISSLMLMGFGFDVAGWFGGLPQEKLLTTLEAGPFKPGTQAIGVENDINNLRAVGNGLIPASPLNDYLNAILAKLLESAGIKDYPGKIYIRAAMLQWDAQTTADGNIYINAGTLRNLETEDQVAALLAHELSHALLKHHDSDMFVKFQKQFQTLGEWGVIAKAVVGSIADETRPEISGSDSKKLRNAHLLILLSSYVVSPAWNRKQESEADRLGLDILAKAGYNIYAMMDLLEKDQAWQKNFAQALEPTAINETISQTSNTQTTSAEPIDLVAIFRKSLEKLTDTLSQKHPDPAERLKTYRQYAQKFYRGTEPPEQNSHSWNAAKLNPASAQILENYEWAYRAEKMLADSDSSTLDMKRIELCAQLSLRGNTANHAYPLLVASQVFSVKGDRKSALSLLEKATRSPETVGLVYMHLAQFYAQQGDHAKALQAAQDGYKRLNEAPTLKPQMVRYFKAAGDNSGATAMAEQCALQSPEYKEQCREANAEKRT